MREPAKHCWPLLVKIGVNAPCSASSMTADSVMMLADLPPSSRPTLFNAGLAAAAMDRQVAVPPVNDTTRTCGTMTLMGLLGNAVSCAKAGVKTVKAASVAAANSRRLMDGVITLVSWVWVIGR